MHRSIAFTLAGLMAATPLAAQFEGTVTMKMSGHDKGQQDDITVKMAMAKDGRTVTLINMPAGAGPMAGMEMRSIMDPNAHTMTTLTPLPPAMAAQIPGAANAKGMKMVMDMNAMQANGSSNNDDVSITKLGTSETVAGLSCDDYEIKTSKETTRACVTEALGHFIYPPSGGGGMGRRGGASSAPPAWTKAFGNKPMFPLKVWSTDGSMAMQVVAIDKSPVPSSLFDVPDGYMDMSAMMGGMRGRPPLDR